MTQGRDGVYPGYISKNRLKRIRRDVQCPNVYWRLDYYNRIISVRIMNDAADDEKKIFVSLETLPNNNSDEYRWELFKVSFPPTRRNARIIMRQVIDFVKNGLSDIDIMWFYEQTKFIPNSN